MKSRMRKILWGVTILFFFLSVPVWGADVVKIGYSGPLSGGAAKYGKNSEAGLVMAMEEINGKLIVISEPGVGTKIIMEGRFY